MIERIDLDHVAVAMERWPQAWPRYRAALGGEWVAGGGGVGFASCQLRYRNGMKLEVLEPFGVEQNDFLRRFLDRNGPGPHHLTFKVGDIMSALEAAEASGYRPVGVFLDDDEWKEAFLHPKDIPGVVVQLAESRGSWESDPPDDLPPSALERPASLDRVVHAVADLDEGLRLFGGLLRGEQLDKGEDDLGTWVELGWPGPGRVRIVRLRDDSWLQGAAGRIHHLAFTIDGGVDHEVAPEDNLGVRLCISGEA